MKFIITILLIINVASTSFAQDDFSKLISSIKTQVNQYKSVEKEIGREKIGKLVFKKLNESKVTLAQIKASHQLTKSFNKVDVNELYMAIEKILNPKSVILKRIFKKQSLKNNGTGVIRGLVTNSLAGEKLSNIEVKLYDSLGNYISSRHTDFGRYQFLNLDDGDYFIMSFDDNFVNTVYPSTFCDVEIGNGCQIHSLTPITISNGSILTDIDLSLSLTPTISGVVYDSNDIASKIAAAKISVFNTNGEFIKRIFTNVYGNDKGHFKISVPKDGDYYLVAEHSDYNKEIHDNVICQGECDFNSGTLIHLGLNQ